MSIDPNSPTYLFGEIKTELRGLKKQMEDFGVLQRTITTLLGSLPCEREDIRIKNLEKKVTLHNDSINFRPRRFLTGLLATGNIGFVLLLLYFIAKMEGWLR